MDLLCLHKKNNTNNQNINRQQKHQQQQLSHSNYSSSSSSSNSSIWYRYCSRGSFISKSFYRWSGYQATHDSDDDCYEDVSYDSITTTAATATTNTVCNYDSTTNSINRCTSIDGNFNSSIINRTSIINSSSNSNGNILVNYHPSILNPMISHSYIVPIACINVDDDEKVDT